MPRESHGLRSGHGPRFSRAAYPVRRPLALEEERGEPVGDGQLLFFDMQARQQQGIPEHEVRLRLAVIERALADLRGESPVLRAHALDWVNGGGRGSGFGLADIAETFGLDAEAARRGILAQVGIEP